MNLIVMVLVVLLIAMLAYFTSISQKHYKEANRILLLKTIHLHIDMSALSGVGVGYLNGHFKCLIGRVYNTKVNQFCDIIHKG